MKKIVITVLVAALIFAAINDIGRYLIGMYTLDDSGRTAVFEAAKVATDNRAANSGWPTAWQIANDKGVELISYKQDATGVTAVGRIFVGGTFIVGPVHALLTRQPIGTPFMMEQTFQSQ